MGAVKKPAGRPEFKPTHAQRRRVAISAGAGMRHEDIAIAIGVSRPTLAKYFEFELSHGALSKRADVLEALYDSAMKGNVTAQKAYAAMESPQVAAPPVAGEPAPDKRGKKEQANLDARSAQAGTDWETLLPRSSTPQ